MITFKPAENDAEELMFERIVSEDGKIFIGVHVVMFGYRVRAGYVGDICYQIDWCGGADQSQVELLYSMAKNIVERKGNFVGMPGNSKIKPFFKDAEFVALVSSMLTQPLEIIKLKPLQISREEIFKQNSNLGEFI